MLEYLPLIMFGVVCAVLMLGYPVAFTLAGVSLIFAGIGIYAGVFELQEMLAYTERAYGIMTNTSLIAVPMFIFMGVMLERSKIAEALLHNLAHACGRAPAGMAISVVLVGTLMAASTGIVGATVVTMGLMSLPTMLKRGYEPALACGTICATGTLGQIIPPSIALVLLGDVLSSAYQQAQLNLGVFNATPISVGDLFIGAMVPGIVLVLLYLLYLAWIGVFKPELAPPNPDDTPPPISELIKSIVPPILLMVLVLGSIITGQATPTEASGVGALAATLLAVARRQFSLKALASVVRSTAKVTTMVFAILLGSALFSLVFRDLGGEQLIHGFFHDLPGGTFMAVLIVMLVIFLLGFILDFIEITFVVVPIIAPTLLMMGVDPIWLGIMIAINLQTSFLTPPFGFALFYLRGVAPQTVATSAIYKGVIPFIILQVLLMVCLALWPSLATWLPNLLR
ncbi:TRAP transporter large permease subunit [Saccharophagus degradans]|uniref:TRAP transporter large permease n=1 Tax=Saccharophagus degradans TaxID=86304 RepID=UPI001C094EF3|nr:TRAP transporter large permease subunit [Saccharophagus degradans]MBU2984927.1 TRAP transporter large permease subunit [Saccharophagus degradans]